jgi:NADH-quinone oxidoreductase subunit C
VRSKTSSRSWRKNSRKCSREDDQAVIPSEVEGSRCATHSFRHGVLRLRFAQNERALYADMNQQEIFDSLGQAVGEKLQNKTEFRGETTYTIAASDLREIAKFCRDEISFDYLLDITSIDNFGEEPRFEIVYHLYSMPHGAHLRLKLRVSEDVGALDTVSDIWPTADWHEREIYDMMGIKFNGHPDLRRILMWDGYPFFPLRKDFPLAGLPSDMPDVAFTKVTPLEGGPFVTVPSTAGSKDREPRARPREL